MGSNATQHVETRQPYSIPPQPTINRLLREGCEELLLPPCQQLFLVALLVAQRKRPRPSDVGGITLMPSIAAILDHQVRCHQLCFVRAIQLVRGTLPLRQTAQQLTQAIRLRAPRNVRLASAT